MHITGLYAALCTFIVLILALRVVIHRNRHAVGIGSGGNSSLEQLIRVHANAVENVPLALLLLLILELNQTPPVLLHLFGIVLVIARIIHAIGLSSSPGRSAGRMIGAACTWLVMFGMAFILAWQYVVGVMLA